MTNRAARARLRLRDCDSLANASRARVEEDSVSAGVKIFLRPGDVLTALFASTTMTTGRFAADRADEFSGIIGSLRKGATGRND